MSKKVLCLLAAALFTSHSLTALAAEPASCRTVRVATYPTWPVKPALSSFWTMRFQDWT